MSDFFNDLPLMILALPAILLSLSVHEASHGFVANKLGDPTAKNLGRLTLNPLKHINLFGFICMLFFNVGWANPVPINTRNFKNPRKGMAISAAAGPLSNLCLAIIFTILLRLVLIPLSSMMDSLYILAPNGYWLDESLRDNASFTILSLLAVMFYLGISLNLNLMFFNLSPLPPLDGSRIASLLIPQKYYFKIMQYERYIILGVFALIIFGVLDTPMSFVTGKIMSRIIKLTGLPFTFFG